MTYLQMCQRACVECGVASNTAVATALPTVIGATGSVGRVVNWVADAFSDIAQDHDDWSWLRSSQILGQGVSFTTVNGQASYPLGTGPGTVGVATDVLGKWDAETFWSFTTSNGFSDEIPLGEVTFDYWRAVYMNNANRNVRTRPVAFAIGPDLSINLGPNVNGNYTVTGDYFMVAPVLAADADVPLGLPTRFHMLVVYRAMIKYGFYESAQEVTARGNQENDGMYAQLQALRAPRISFGGALA